MHTTPALKARLVHAEAGLRVVQVSAWLGTSCLGSALGEANTAEAAEERAIHRLQQRLATAPVTEQQTAEPQPGPTVRHPVVRQAQQTAAPPVPPPETIGIEAPPQPSLFADPPPPPQTPAAEIAHPSTSPTEPSADPEDWSDELAELDVQLQRIGWERNQESTYLQRAFGHPSRNRLTAFADLVAYLRSLRLLQQGADPASAPVPLRRKDLLEQCDQLLNSLQWDAQRGRQLLEQHFRLNSRQQLSDEQLLQFNMLLEEALMTAGHI